MPVHGGGTKVTKLGFKFVDMVPGEEMVPVADYVHHMFTPFKAEYNGKYDDGIKKRVLVYEGKPQFIYEVANPNYD